MKKRVETLGMLEMFIHVPKNRVFVMKDNRNHSSDSKKPIIWPIPQESIEAHSIAVTYPLDHLRGVN